MNGELRSCRHKYRIELLCLAFQQPLGDFMAATGERFAEDESTGIAAHVAGDFAAVSYHRGRL